MSTLIVEIVLTKFLGIKVDHHYAYAILGMVVLSFGAAGAFIYVRDGQLGTNSNRAWQLASHAASAYAIALPLVVAASSLLVANKPISGTWCCSWLCLLALPLYFFILSVPFVFGGICITHTLSACRLPVTLIYFWDLLAAAVGAFICPWLLQLIGGYGVMAVASLLGVVGAISFYLASDSRPRATTILSWSSALFLGWALTAYPELAMQKYGYDVRSSKAPQLIGITEKVFGGVRDTHWNAVARVDISKTAVSDNSYFLAGLSPKSLSLKLPGRFILNDGGAYTRQFRVNGSLSDQHYLGNSLWASPYWAHGDGLKHVLVIGGGGGIDILIAKYFKVPALDVVEINPSTYDLLRGANRR